MVSEAAANAKGGQATSMVANIKKGRQETRNNEHNRKGASRDDSHNKNHAGVRGHHLCATSTPLRRSVRFLLTGPALTVLPPYCSGGEARRGAHNGRPENESEEDRL